jgi:hypothetical protein
MAPDERHAAAVKVIENYYRYNAVLLANQPASLHPAFDMAELLRLASTKRNQELYHPSFGIGGYCLPLTKDYLADSAPMASRQFDEDLETAESQSALDILSRIFPGVSTGQRRVILGLAYAPGIRVHTRSPTLRVVPLLRSRGWTVLVQDPLYSPDEIRAITGAESARFPEDLGTCDQLLLMTGHSMYRQMSDVTLRQPIGPGHANRGQSWGRARPCGSGRHVRRSWLCKLQQGGPAASRARGIHPEANIAAAREWLVTCEASGQMDVVFDYAAPITNIDRPYIIVDFGGDGMRISAVADRVAQLRGRPVRDWTEKERDSVCALALLGIARVRLENVKLDLSLSTVLAHLRQQLEMFHSHLAEAGLTQERAIREMSDLEIDRSMPEARLRMDEYFVRIAEIDGVAWYGAERVLARHEVDSVTAPERLCSAMKALGADNPSSPVESAVTSLICEAAGDVVRVTVTVILEAVLTAAADDPFFTADHATLLAPRGTNLDKPWEFGRTDFMAWVVFRRGFVPHPPLADISTIRRSMYAHHSVKKERLARKYIAKYGPNGRASLEDDLRDLGIYFNESEHESGHLITGIQLALRYLMPIEVKHAGTTLRVEGLTDFRLTRATPGEAARFSVAHFPGFLANGRTVGALVQAANSTGVVLQPVLGL